MRKIFVSYRREPDQYVAGNLSRELRQRFGDSQVFRDKEGIEGGVSWRYHVLNEINGDSVLLVLIGREWSQARDSAGNRRLDKPDDPIRLEIEEAMRERAAIIPLLLENAQMPTPSELPSQLMPLAELNALKLRDGDWEADVAKIVKRLEKLGIKRVAAPDPQPVAIKRSAKAIWSLAMIALIAISLVMEQHDRETLGGYVLLSVIALGLAGFAYFDVQQRKDSGKGIAIAGLVASTLMTLIALNMLMETEAMNAASPGGNASGLAAPQVATPSGSAPTQPIALARSGPQGPKPPLETDGAKAIPAEPKVKNVATASPEPRIKKPAETLENALIGIWYSETKEEVGAGQTVIVRGTTEYLRNKSATSVGQVSLSLIADGTHVEVIYNIIGTSEWQLDGNKLTMKLIDLKSVPRSIRGGGKEVDLRSMPSPELASLPRLESLIPKGMSSEGEIIESGPNSFKLKTRDSSGRQTTTVAQKRDRPFALL
jgi:hypothetical protein